jgi:hypothetical protein
VGFEHVPDQVHARKTRQCPVRLPFLELATFVRAKAPAKRALLA